MRIVPVLLGSTMTPDALICAFVASKLVDGVRALRTISLVDRSVRFRSFENRLFVATCAVLAVGLAWAVLNIVLIGLAELFGVSTQLALTVATAVSVPVALVGVFLSCRVALYRDEAGGTVTVVNLLTRSEFAARELVAVRVVPFPWVRQRGPSVGTSPMIELKTRDGRQVRLFATALGTKRGRSAALGFLKAAGVRPLPSRREFVDGLYVAQEWTPIESHARPGRS